MALQLVEGVKSLQHVTFVLLRKNAKWDLFKGDGNYYGLGGASILYEKLPPHEAMKILLEANTYSTDQLKELGFVQRFLKKLIFILQKIIYLIY